MTHAFILVCNFTSVFSYTAYQVVLAGGLHVIGTERHESRRIDNQVANLWQFDALLKFEMASMSIMPFFLYLSLSNRTLILMMCEYVTEN